MADQYRIVEALLVEQAESLGLDLPQQEGEGPEALPFSQIYMIGDNPASDIRGARNAGEPSPSHAPQVHFSNHSSSDQVHAV